MRCGDLDYGAAVLKRWRVRAGLWAGLLCWLCRLNGYDTPVFPACTSQGTNGNISFTVSSEDGCGRPRYYCFHVHVKVLRR